MSLVSVIQFILVKILVEVGIVSIVMWKIACSLKLEQTNFVTALKLNAWIAPVSLLSILLSVWVSIVFAPIGFVSVIGVSFVATTWIYRKEKRKHKWILGSITAALQSLSFSFFTIALMSM